MDIINESRRVARKDHVCDLCCDTIKPGESYFYQFIRDGGETWEFKAHDNCEFIMRELWEYADPFDYFTEDDFNESAKAFCKEFICKDCQHYNDTYFNDCDKEEPYCIDKIVSKLKTHYIHKDYNRNNPIFCKFYLKERYLENNQETEKSKDNTECEDPSSIYNWAQNEIELAYKKLQKSGADDSKYTEACYSAALEAYNFICNQNHSGMSIAITKNILNRLLDKKCLTPIYDTDDIWSECWKRDDYIEYQCKRMSSLFKRVYDDGKIEYHDIDRFIGCYEGSHAFYHSGALDKVMEKLFPITLPYIPEIEPFKIYTEDYLVDSKHGDYDTVAYLYCITPYGDKLEINKFFKETDDGKDMIEISKLEYLVRKIRALNRERKRKSSK